MPALVPVRSMRFLIFFSQQKKNLKKVCRCASILYTQKQDTRRNAQQNDIDLKRETRPAIKNPNKLNLKKRKAETRTDVSPGDDVNKSRAAQNRGGCNTYGCGETIEAPVPPAARPGKLAQSVKSFVIYKATLRIARPSDSY